MHESTAQRYDAEQLGRRNNAELLRLRYHWDTAYIVAVDFPHSWSAMRRDDGTVLAADSSAELRQLIIADYSSRPVPRHGSVGGD